METRLVDYICQLGSNYRNFSIEGLTLIINRLTDKSSLTCLVSLVANLINALLSLSPTDWKIAYNMIDSKVVRLAKELLTLLTKEVGVCQSS